MRVLTSAQSMIRFAENAKLVNSCIGFVPTMGALHAGHLSLIEAAKRESDLVVVSVFVNPTQFNNASDLDKYPRTFDSDRSLLEDSGVDVMFFPSVEEIYPAGTEDQRKFELDGLDELMEGPNRPGHFNGVVQVVTRLFDLVEPSKAFFGEKDFQQLAIIKHMSSKLGYRIDIVGCDTVRESDGLAMSSRNVRLTSSGRTIAPEIHRTLEALRNELRTNSVEEVLARAKAALLGSPEIELEYLELVDPITLKRATDDSISIQGCIAAWIDDVRLIDNMRVK
jgi:pantoate--beta-alanine ligase